MSINVGYTEIEKAVDTGYIEAVAIKKESQEPMPRKKREYAPGENPNSQENLQPREPIFGERKKRRELTVTEEGWIGVKSLAKDSGCTGVSDLLEKLGRGLIEIKNPAEK